MREEGVPLWIYQRKLIIRRKWKWAHRGILHVRSMEQSEGVYEWDEVCVCLYSCEGRSMKRESSTVRTLQRLCLVRGVRFIKSRSDRSHHPNSGCRPSSHIPPSVKSLSRNIIKTQNQSGSGCCWVQVKKKLLTYRAVAKAGERGRGHQSWAVHESLHMNGCFNAATINQHKTVWIL